MRTPDELLASGLAVLETALQAPSLVRGKKKYPEFMAPLLSGGHDSIAACHVASRHPRFGGKVYHINTGIGAKRTRQHVEDTCRELGWELVVLKSANTYEQFVRDRGFPGPGMHQWTYIRLKERCVRMITRRRRVALVTGCRRQESTRRMGHVEPLKIGETVSRKGVERVEQLNRYWVAPCYDWSAEEQAAYMEEHDLPRNPVKIALGMSGECFCGAFASPGELDRIRHHCPDVAEEIDRLAVVARECGKHDRWGERPPGSRGVVAVQSGELCSSCDLRAKAAGIVFKGEKC